MFRTFLDSAPLSLQHDTPTSSSLRYPSQRTNPSAPQPELLFGRFCRTDPAHNSHHLAVTIKHLIHRAAGLFGRLAIQCRLTGYMPNAIVEIGSPEVTSIHRPSRRTSFCSVYNSGEDVTSARVSSEVDESQSIERLVPTAAHAEERSKCNPCENLSLCMRIFHVTLITHSKHGETCCNTLTQTEVEQRHEKRTGETFCK